MDLREMEGPTALRAKLREQLPQTGSTILDERAERHNLGVLPIKEVGFDSLVGSDGETRDLVFPCREGLDRALPAHLMDLSRRSRRRILSEETIGGEIVDRHGDHKP